MSIELVGDDALGNFRCAGTNEEEDDEKKLDDLDRRPGTEAGAPPPLTYFSPGRGDSSNLIPLPPMPPPRAFAVTKSPMLHRSRSRSVISNTGRDRPLVRLA